MAWATRLKNKFFADPFRVARIETAALYVVVGGAIILTTDYFIDNDIRNSMYSIVMTDKVNPVQDAFAHVQTLLWVSRLIKLFLYAVAVYFITGFAMRHIRAASEKQRRFIATASHELRTPLAVMKNAKEVALRHPETLTREKAIEIMRTNLVEVNRLSETVQFLLAFSHLENRQKHITLARIDIAALLRDSIALLQESAESAGVTVTCDAPETLCMEGNATTLREVILNLIKNALTYTSSGGSVVASLRETNSHVIIKITDTGIGIPKKDLPHIFEPFYRGDLAEGHGTNIGMGLGLAVVREIVRLHRGSIDVQSTVGVGTSISVRFHRAGA